MSTDQRTCRPLARVACGIGRTFRYAVAFTISCGGNVFKHLLVPVDEYSVEDDDFASLRTLALADDARVTLVHISDPLPPTFYLQNGYGGDYITVADHKKACTSYAHRLFKRAEQKIGTLVRTDTLHLFNADVAAGIVDAVKTAGADGILMVSHKRSGLAGLVMGSETRDVMRKASVPLLVL